MNKKSLESLTKAGAFDSLGVERNQILENIDDILKFSNALRRGSAQNGANSLFGGGTLATPRLTLKPATPATNEQKLGWEKELIGFYLSEHPMTKHAETIELARARTIPELTAMTNEKITVRTCGLVSKIKKIITKSGQPMIFATIEDAAQKPLEVVVFNSVLEKTSKSWEENNIVLVQGRMSFRDGQAKLICDNAKRLS
jgi:DNA polymerase-3 subunit alpha